MKQEYFLFLKKLYADLSYVIRFKIIFMQPEIYSTSMSLM